MPSSRWDVEIPDDVTCVVVWADHDVSETGINVAEQLKERLLAKNPNITVIINIPDWIDITDGRKRVEWLDIYTRLGAEVFPDRICDPRFAVKTGVSLLEAA